MSNENFQVFTYTNIEDQSAILYARVRLETAYLVKNDISSMDVTVSEEDNASTKTANAVSVDKEDVVFNTLQTNAAVWTVDDEGYNIRLPAEFTWFPEEKNYLVELKVTLTSNQVFHIVWRQLTHPLNRS